MSITIFSGTVVNKNMSSNDLHGVLGLEIRNSQVL